MNNQACALTFDGYVDIETAVPLSRLDIGDTVLGIADPNDPGNPRTVYLVTATLGRHHVPTEDPSILERLVAGVRLQRLLAGEPKEGILVIDEHGNPALFALQDTPVLDRVIF